MFKTLSVPEEELISSAIGYFSLEVMDSGHLYKFFFPRHIELVGKMAEKILYEGKEYGYFKNVNEFYLRLAVALHDIGHVKNDRGYEDHAVASEYAARKFLERKWDVDIDSGDINKVCQAIRSHRNSDVKPQTDEARILVAADSASHLVDVCYVDMLQRFSLREIKEKLERDLLDLEVVRREITGTSFWRQLIGLGESWGKILDNWPEFLLEG
ncbi:MAG: HD domain-containing protein [Candidatus Paceibacterota bacterium]